jgi:hypothetical protein
MAIAWLVEHGVFPINKHNQLYKKYVVQKEQRKKTQARQAIAAVPSPNRARKGILAKKHGVRKVLVINKRPRM